MARRVAYFCIGLCVTIFGGLQNGFFLANLSTLQANAELTPSEGAWVKAAYYMIYACMSMLLFRVRQHLGIPFFVRLALWALLGANVIQLFAGGYWAFIVSRCLSAVASSGMISLSIYYFMQSVPAKVRPAAIIMGIGLYQIGYPLGRAITPALVISGDLHHLYLFEFSMTLVVVALINLFPLPPGVRIPVFRKLDLISFPLLAGGLGLLFAFLMQGMVVWWDKLWLGYMLVAAILMIGAALLIERARPHPMLQLRWLSGREIVVILLGGALVRMGLSEQNYGALGFLTTTGWTADQTVTYNWILVAATVAGVLAAIVKLDPTDLKQPIWIATGLIAIASFMDMHSGLETGPVNFYWSQAMLAFATSYFMGPAMLDGMARAMVQGPSYIVSYVAVFSLGQTLGAYIGAASLFTLQSFWTKDHLIQMAQRYSISDPMVARQISQLASGISPTLADPQLQQAEAVTALTQKLALLARVESYNQAFAMIGILASFVTVILVSNWLYKRWTNRSLAVSANAAIQASRERVANAQRTQ